MGWDCGGRGVWRCVIERRGKESRKKEETERETPRERERTERQRRLPRSRASEGTGVGIKNVHLNFAMFPITPPPDPKLKICITMLSANVCEINAHSIRTCW